MGRKNIFIRKGLPIFLFLVFLPLRVWAADYYVASSGSDTNDGSVVSPWKTVTHALQQATAGDAIHVAAGTYSTLTGESFPLNMTEGVSLLGASRETTILDGGSTATVVSAKGISGGTLAGFTITNGSATQGGGIYAVNSGISIMDNIISQNSAGAGGGIYAAGGAASISANQITENQAYMYGGGLYLADFSGTVERNIILSNQATRGSGGGIYAVNFSGKLNNNLVAKNVASSVGGVYAANFDASSEIINNTIADNFATLSDSAGGMQASGVSSVLKNNIFWNNKNGDEDDDLYGGLVATDDTLGTINQESIGISYSLIENYAGQNNNIYTNPLFVDPANNDYHLGDGSPVLDIGTTEGAPTLDMEGNARPQGASVDLGAYEYAAAGPPPGGTIIVRADKHLIGTGSHPGSTKEPYSGLTVKVYDKSASSCVAGHGFSWQYYNDIVNSCTPLVNGTTDGNGDLTLLVDAGEYLVIGVGVDGPDKHLGTSATVGEDETVEKYLQLLVKADGKKSPGKSRVQTGSKLLIVEPEYVEWDSTQELYPFVFESLDNWSITVDVAPPEGFVPDYNSLGEEVTNEVEAVQFIITDVGSEWKTTKVKYKLEINGKKIKIVSEIGVLKKEKKEKKEK